MIKRYTNRRILYFTLQQIKYAVVIFDDMLFPTTLQQAENDYVDICSEMRDRRGIDDITRMWANAQPDGRPAEHRWRPLFNAAKFG